MTRWSIPPIVCDSCSAKTVSYIRLINDDKFKINWNRKGGYRLRIIWSTSHLYENSYCTVGVMFFRASGRTIRYVRGCMHVANVISRCTQQEVLANVRQKP